MKEEGGKVARVSQGVRGGALIHPAAATAAGMADVWGSAGAGARAVT